MLPRCQVQQPANTAAVAAFAAHGGSGLFADAKLGVEGVGRSGGHSSNDFQRELTGGHYTASNLPSSLRGLVDPSQGITPAHVAGVANYLGGLGLNPQSYAPYFLGSSSEARKAIADHIKNGKAVTDEDVKKPRDVAAYIGAIKSGKMKLGDAPPSVQQIIGDMKKQGIDATTADPKIIQKYLKDHPKALDAAKAANKKDIAARAGLTTDQLNERAKKDLDAATAQQKKKPTPSTTPTVAKKEPKKTTSAGFDA